ncbi:MAG: hypothetical protein AAFN81_10830 [Bacteroidota bacterium]
MEKFKQVKEYNYPDVECNETLGDFYDSLKRLVEEYGREAQCSALIDDFEVITLRQETSEEMEFRIKRDRKLLEGQLEYHKRQVKEFSDKLGIVTEE